MKYHFANMTEFGDFMRDAREKGTFSEFEVKINGETKRNLHNWNWLERDYLYLTTNPMGDLFYVYRHPSSGFEYLWWFSISGVQSNTGKWNLDGPDAIYWVEKFIKLEGRSLTFMNWFDEDPFEEVKG